MKALVFDIKGKFAHFKAMETTRHNISFPFPPRTALIGLIASIMGIPRNTYWQEGQSLATAPVALEVLNPIQRIGMKVNYLQTRSPYLTLRGKETVTLLVPIDPFEIESVDQRGFNAPVRLDLLKDVHYRVYFNIDDDSFYQAFKTRLMNHVYCFPPYLGHANLLAEVSYTDEVTLTPLPEGSYHPSSLIAADQIAEEKIPVDSLGYSMIYNVPMRMKFTKKYRKTDRIKAEHVVLAKMANIFLNKAFEKERLRAIFKTNAVHEGKVLGESRQVCFFPVN